VSYNVETSKIIIIKENRMALTGIQIFKLLPKTNCGECKFPTCLAFAMALASGKAELDACPYVADDAREQLSDASAPPIRQLTIGTGDFEVKIGGETVLFRHERTFFNKPGLAVLITDSMDDAEAENRFGKLAFLQYERVGLTLRPELVALKETGNKERFINLVKRACKEPYSIILMSFDQTAMKAALEIAKDRKPLIYAATENNYEAFGELAKEYGCPLAVAGRGMEGVADLTGKLTGMGLKDLVIDTSTRTIKESFQEQLIIRRAAIMSKHKPLGFPTIVFPAEMTDDLMKETLIASCFIAKYAGIIVMSDFEGESIFPLLLQRLNIYTDPQRPMTTQEGIYPVNNPDENSPVLVTCNFTLSYFIVSGEIENSRVPSWLCVMDTEGLSVMTAWAAGKFSGDIVGIFIKKSGIADKVAHRKLIIPGYAAMILGDLEEELKGWEIIVGPREAAHIPAYLRMQKM
jgi:acetyl-CoA decarbonylase/synthase complex subunit gamma